VSVGLNQAGQGERTFAVDAADLAGSRLHTGDDTVLQVEASTLWLARDARPGWRQ